MLQINIAEAKKHLSEIIGKVAFAKESVLLTKRGIPMAEINPVSRAGKHPADVKGWLDDDDDFFGILESRKSLPRVLKKNARS